jgi:hypothetical protein
LVRKNLGQDIEEHVSREHEGFSEAPMSGNEEVTISVGSGTSARTFTFSAPHRSFVSGFNNALSWLPELLARLLGEEGEAISERYNMRTTAVDTDITESDDVLLCNCSANAIEASLISATHTGKMLTIIKTDASENAVTVSAFGNDLIEGQSSVTLSGQYDKVTLVSDGVSSWFKIA